MRKGESISIGVKLPIRRLEIQADDILGENKISVTLCCENADQALRFMEMVKLFVESEKMTIN